MKNKIAHNETASVCLYYTYYSDESLCSNVVVWSIVCCIMLYYMLYCVIMCVICCIV